MIVQEHPHDATLTTKTCSCMFSTKMPSDTMSSRIFATWYEDSLCHSGAFTLHDKIDNLELSISGHIHDQECITVGKQNLV